MPHQGLIIFGAEENIIAEKWARKWDLPRTSGPKVYLAFGKEEITSTRETKILPFLSQGATFNVSLNVLPVLAFDMVLGQSCWRTYGPKFE